MIGIKRSAQAPRSLVAGTAVDRYRSRDVVEQLVEDSGNKCYICEISPVDDPEVEHLSPHEGGKFPERKYDWDNLFYACRHCNQVKNKRKYARGIIDCCKRDPELLLSQELAEDRVCVEVMDSDDCEARCTADLIEEVFMTENPALRELAASARLKALQLRMNALYTKLEEYQNEKREEGKPRAFTEKTVAAMLDRKAAFAGFTRCYVRMHLESYPELSGYLK